MVIYKPFELGDWQDNYVWMYDKYKMRIIKYLHELQNLYYILSGGNELEVKL